MYGSDSIERVYNQKINKTMPWSSGYACDSKEVVIFNT